MNESAGLHDQLLATKFFIPASSHALILRPRLLALLMKSFECPLTLVSAPAGFGKTTLLSNWIHALPPERARVAWVSVDEGDNEPTLFWRYVLTALDRALPGLCAELVAYLHAQEEVSGSQRYIFDYLMEEVFQRQSVAVQTLLLQTSILTQLSAPLCDAVLEQSGSQQVLEQLERANLFLVSLDGQRQ
ncbi:MAG TPA: hypothetical protein VF221_21465, partial [Chloroflexota bacterium]